MHRPFLCSQGPNGRKHWDGCPGEGKDAGLQHPTLKAPLQCPCSTHFSLKRTSGVLACTGSEGSGKVYHLPVAPVDMARQDLWFVHRPCACNVLNALFGRVGKCVPPPDPDALTSLLVPQVAVMAQFVGRHAQVPYESVYLGMPAKKRDRYRRAHINLDESGRWCKQRDARISMFVKLEGIKYSLSKPNPDCRAIQFRSPEYTLQLSSSIKAAEHLLYDLCDLPGFGPGRLFAKNLNQFDKAAELIRKYESIPGCKILCLDASRFDAHCSRLILDLVEHEFWRRTCLAPQIKDLLRWQLSNVGVWRRADQYIRYEVNGGRMSGDANTAAGNCIIMASMLAAFGQYTGRKFTFLCDGDDSVFFHDGDDISDETIKDFFVQFGFVMEVEDRPSSIFQTTFCQARPCLIDGRPVMIRSPFKILSRTTVNHKLRDPHVRAKYVKTVALGELSISRGSPVIQTYLIALIRNCDRHITARQRRAGSVYQWAVDDNYRLRSLLPRDWKSGRTVEVTAEARLSFSESWGISVAEQIAIERTLEAWHFDLGKDQDGGEWDVDKWLPPCFRPEEW